MSPNKLSYMAEGEEVAAQETCNCTTIQHRAELAKL